MTIYVPDAALAALPAPSACDPVRLDDLAPWFSGDVGSIDIQFPCDLTGCTAEWVITATWGGAALVTKALGVPSPTNGIGQAAMLATDTDALPADPLRPYYRHEGRVTDAVGNIRTLVYGQIPIRAIAA